MRRDHFVGYLKKMGACAEGIRAARASKGMVADVAKEWASSKLTKRNYFNWLKTSIDCQVCAQRQADGVPEPGNGWCRPDGINEKQRDALRKVILAAES